jgi:hypothetical protein
MKESERQLHVVSFDIPYPPDYGGVIDVFFKLKALVEEGVKIRLHCYEYGRERSSELEKFCHSVNYYKRRVFKNPFLGKLPYIVSSRNSEELLENLVKDDAPILFEGLHSCYYLNHPSLKKRFRMVRTHNIEHHYYSNLEKVERNYFKKYFFRLEAEKLRKFEKMLQGSSSIAAISPSDESYFHKKYRKVFYLPAFHSNTTVVCEPGRGDFVLYHGNLGVGENNEAALYLVNRVFSKLENIKLVIAGNNPSKELKNAILSNRNISLHEDASSEAIYDLIRNAHINVLPTFQGTGIKLKLINVLFRGRFCVVNETMVKNTGLEKLCVIKSDPGEMAATIAALMDEEFTEAELKSRYSVLKKFDTVKNAGLLMSQLFRG